MMRRIYILLVLSLLACGCKAQGLKRYNIEVVKEYPHDVGAYTQGLFFHDGKLYESTGQYGSSSIRIADLETGVVKRRLNFANKYFGEGSVILGSNFYVLTWTNKVAFVYDAATLEYKQSYSYPREGWGLTTDGKSLIASDGTSRLFFLSPEFKLEKTITVKMNGKPLRFLNELEWIDGRIWANVYTTDLIVIINPSSGEVEAAVNCAGLLPDKMRKADTDVLNGIAVDAAGKIYLTGKNWPRLYEIRLVPAKK